VREAKTCIILPDFYDGAGAPDLRERIAPPRNDEGRGAPKGAPCSSRVCETRRRPCDRTPRLPALHVRCFSVRPRFSGTAVSPFRLSRLPAGRFAPGRSSEPPACALTNAPAEPHPAPPRERLRKAPLASGVKGIWHRTGIKSRNRTVYFLGRSRVRPPHIHGERVSLSSHRAVAVRIKTKSPGVSSGAFPFRNA